MTDRAQRYDLKQTLRAAMEAADGDYDPDAVIAWLARHGFVVVLDPEHAPDAVEAAAKVLYPHDEAAWLAAYNTAGKLRLTNRATAAITAYIEHART